MKQITVLAIKEWRESRIYLVIGLFIFIGLPVIGFLEAHGRTRPLEIGAAPWVSIFGGVLTVFVAVGSTCRDLSGRLEDFWRSCPVTTTRWLTVKFCVGLLISLVACITPLIAQLCTHHNDSDQLQWLIFCFIFSLTAIFSVAFAAGCLLRRTAQAAMVSLAAMLLIYFLPFVLPPLSWMNMGSVAMNRYESDSDWKEVGFMAGMLAVSIVGLSVAYVALYRDWRIESGKRILYGSVSLALLILLASVAFQVGTDLKVVQQTDLGSGQDSYGLVDKGGSVYTEVFVTVPGNKYLDRRYRKISSTPHGLDVGPIENLTEAEPVLAVVAGATGILYQPHSVGDITLLDDGEWERGPLPDGKDPMKLQPTPLLLGNWFPPKTVDENSFIYHANGKLYLFRVQQKQDYGLLCDRLVTFDVSNPEKVKIVSDTPVNFAFDSGFLTGDTLTVVLPPIPELTLQQRLEIGMHFDRYHALSGRTLCCAESFFDGGSLSEYHLFRNNESSAVFLKVGEEKPSWVQQMFGSVSTGQMTLDHGLLYQLHNPAGFVNASVDVFDTNGPHPLRQIGHFTAPDFRYMHVMPDGKLLAAGRTIYLVQPPNPDKN